MNRQLALGLDRSPNHATSIYATEGPGDYEPANEDLAQHAEAAALFDRSKRGAISRRGHSADVAAAGDRHPRRHHLRVLRVGGEPHPSVRGRGLQPLPGRCGGDVGVRPRRPAGLRSRRPDSGGRERSGNARSRGHGRCPGARRTPRVHASSTSARPFPAKGSTCCWRRTSRHSTAPSDVTLILKTFPNPHNQVGEILERLRASHANPPDVRWIDRDLDDREIQAFYNLADCYVHPARGEGFGLPVAEAMAAGVPVISVAYSGLADFVSDEDGHHHPVHSGTRPDPFRHSPTRSGRSRTARLASEMKRLARHPDDPGSPPAGRRAGELIATRFSWEPRRGGGRTSSPILRRAQELAGGHGHDLELAVRHCREHPLHRGELARSIEFELFADVDGELIDPVAEQGVVRTWKTAGILTSPSWRRPSADGCRSAFTSSSTSGSSSSNAWPTSSIASWRPEGWWSPSTGPRLRDQGELLSLKQIRSTLERVDRLIVHQESDARSSPTSGLPAM